MSHSPAPWTFEYVGSSSAGDDGIDVYEVCNERTRIAENLNLADARLIAAAPDMLAVLREVTRCLAWHAEYHGTGMDRKAVAEARAVIAKAEGE